MALSASGPWRSPCVAGSGSWTGQKRAFITPALSLILALREVGAQVAQLVEHVTENHGVGGSIPSLGTIKFLS